MTRTVDPDKLTHNFHLAARGESGSRDRLTAHHAGGVTLRRHTRHTERLGTGLEIRKANHD